MNIKLINSLLKNEKIIYFSLPLYEILIQKIIYITMCVTSFLYSYKYYLKFKPNYLTINNDRYKL